MEYFFGEKNKGDKMSRARIYEKVEEMLIGNPVEKRLLRRPKHNWENNIMRVLRQEDVKIVLSCKQQKLGFVFHKRRKTSWYTKGISEPQEWLQHM